MMEQHFPADILRRVFMKRKSYLYPFRCLETIRESFLAFFAHVIIVQEQTFPSHSVLTNKANKLNRITRTLYVTKIRSLFELVVN
jgi:hypothetical protein